LHLRFGQPPVSRTEREGDGAVVAGERLFQMGYRFAISPQRQAGAAQGFVRRKEIGLQPHRGKQMRQGLLLPVLSGTANTLYHNLGNGRFEDVSVSSGIATAIGKRMSVAIADYDGDGYPDIYVTNDTMPNFLFHNERNGRFREVAFDAGAALTDNGRPVSAMGVDFRDYDNDGRPDIVFTALTRETFPLFRNLAGGQFQDVTGASRLAFLSSKLAGWGIRMPDFDNDGWKDLFTANSHVTDNIELFSSDRYALPNAVFRNQGDGTFTDV
jgi:hypothetical protein